MKTRSYIALPLLAAALVAAPAFAQDAAADAARFTLSDAVWWAFALVAVVSAAVTAFSRNIIYAAGALLGSFGAVAVMFVYLAADFLAVAQVAIYIGGILVLILFAVMMTKQISSHMSNPSIGVALGSTIGAALLALLVWIGVSMPWPTRAPGPMDPTVAELGNSFLGEYLLPFEIASVVLVAVMIGAVVIVRKEVRPEE